MNKEVIATAQKIHAFFTERGYTLSVAESCTGGLISHLITTVPGASNFFEAGVVSYSVQAKKVILRVSSDCIARYGVVSAETAREMATKTRMLMKTDFALSTTGNLGPAVLEGKEKGLIFIAVSTQHLTSVKELHTKGTRAKNKMEASHQALVFLLECAERHAQHQRSPSER